MCAQVNIFNGSHRHGCRFKCQTPSYIGTMFSDGNDQSDSGYWGVLSGECKQQFKACSATKDMEVCPGECLQPECLYVLIAQWQTASGAER